jgi:hypothetical protein
MLKSGTKTIDSEILTTSQARCQVKACVWPALPGKKLCALHTIEEKDPQAFDPHFIHHLESTPLKDRQPPTGRSKKGTRKLPRKRHAPSKMKPGALRSTHR